MDIFVRIGNEIKVSHDQVYLYPALNKLLTTYGKDSNTLNNILSYIYLTSDYRAYPQQKGYSNKESHKYALKNSNLSDKFEVTEDIKNAQKFYKDYVSNSMVEYIENMIKSLRISNKICTYIIDKQDIAEDSSIEQIQKVSNAIKEVLDLSSKINTSIPKLVENIRELKTIEAQENEDKTEKLRGGDNIPSSYIQDSEIEGDD